MKAIVDNVVIGLGSDDYGRFVSYELQSEGSTLEELENNAWVFEVDQDGMEVRDYSLGDSMFYETGIKVLSEALARAQAKE